MRIINFNISKEINGISESKNIPIGQHTSYFSDSNSTGKTTLLRSILYGLGFDIPNTPNVAYDEYCFKLSVVVRKKVFDLERRGSLFVVDGKPFDLPAERTLVHSVLFGESNADILNNILGTFYIDQDYGWTIVGYGHFGGSNMYNLSSLLDGLNHFDDNGLKNEIANISKEIKKYRFIESAVEKRNEFLETESGDIVKNEPTFEVDELKRTLSEVEFKLNKVNNDITNIEAALRKNRRFSSYVSEMNLSVMDPESGNIVPINESTLCDLPDLNESLKYRKLILQGEREKLKQQKINILARIPKYESIVSIKSEADKFLSDINGVDLNGLKTIILQLENEKRKKTETLKQLQSTTNLWINKFLDYVKTFSLFLGNIPEEYYSSTKYIYMKKRPTLSGAMLHQVSLCYHLSAVKICEEKIGVSLPLIIDSPAGREVVEETMNNTLLLLKKYFSKNQIIFATIKHIETIFSDLLIFNPEKRVFDFEPKI